MNFKELGKGKYWVEFDSAELPAIVRLVKTLEETRHSEEQRALENAVRALEGNGAESAPNTLKEQ